MQRPIPPAVMTIALLAGSAAWAAGDSARITLKHHQFVPETLTVPAGKRVKLTVKNETTGKLLVK